MGVFGLPPLVLSPRRAAATSGTSTAAATSTWSAASPSTRSGHGHPALVSAISKQAGEAIHISNLFTSEQQIALAERLIAHRRRPRGLRGLLRQLRRRGDRGRDQAEPPHRPRRARRRRGRLPRPHHRCAGADPQGRLPRALRAAHPGREPRPVRGRGGAARGRHQRHRGGRPRARSRARPGCSAPARHTCALARELTREHGALLVLDEIQTGIGRTGTWFAFQQAGDRARRHHGGQGPGRGRADRGAGRRSARGLRSCSPPASTAPRSAATRWRPRPGWPSSTPSRREGLLAHAARGRRSTCARGRAALGHPLVTGVRGAGLLRAIALARDRGRRRWQPPPATPGSSSTPSRRTRSGSRPRSSSPPTSSTPSSPRCPRPALDAAARRPRRPRRTTR